jgi:queuine tRNA-ribosyltransferase
VRVSLLTAGFFVAQGVGTGPKPDTTIAFTTAKGAGDHPLSPRLLGEGWLRRWRRSGAKFPTTFSNEQRSHFEKLIENHHQFLSES